MMKPDFLYDPKTKQVWDVYGWPYETYETEEEFLKNYPGGKVANSGFVDENHKTGDILTYETDDLKWIFIFTSWYKPYDGHIHYYALVDQNGDYYGSGTCCILEDNCLVPSTDDEKQLLFNKMKESGCQWDSKNKKIIKL